MRLLNISLIVSVFAMYLLSCLYSLSVNAEEVALDTNNDTSISKVKSDKGDSYYRYTNVRYNYSIEFPVWIVPQPEATNSDGRKFLEKDKQCEMLVFGRSRYATIDGSKLTIKQAFKEVLQDRSKSPSKVTYKFLGKDSFVVSGRKDAFIFYEKTILDDEAIKTFSINYPANKAKHYKNAIERISGSFKSTTREKV